MMSGAGRRLLPVADARATLRALLDLLRPHRALTITAAVTVVVWSVIGLAVPPLLGALVDAVVAATPQGLHGTGSAAGTPDIGAIVGPIAGLFVVTIAGGVLGVVADVLLARVGETALATLRERVLERTLALPLEQVEAAGTGDLVSRVGGDVALVADAVQRVLPGMAYSGLTIVLTLVGLTWLDPRFALAALLAVPIQLVALRWYVRRCVPLYAAERVADGEQAQQMLSSIEGAATVRASRLQGRERDRVATRSSAANRLSYQGTVIRTRFYGTLNVAECLGLAAILSVGFVLVGDGSVTIGATAAAAWFFHGLFDPVNAVLGLVDDVLVAGASLARLVGITRTTDRPDPSGPGVARDASVRLVDVRFAYQQGREVVHGVDLDVPAGARVALVGASGAGKSTIARLIAGIHQPDDGSVLVGGIHAAGVTADGQAPAVALVTQERHVFLGTLADDLRLADPDATDEMLLAALDRVGARWARELPEGLGTAVGRGARRLTAAQEQQVALARLILTGRPVAVLDEATAEAGSTDAEALDLAVREATAATTAIIVAHRLSQAVTADRVVVMDAGRVVAAGSHAQLVESDATYARLWAAWARHRPTGAATGSDGSSAQGRIDTSAPPGGPAAAATDA